MKKIGFILAALCMGCLIYCTKGAVFAAEKESLVPSELAESQAQDFPPLDVDEKTLGMELPSASSISDSSVPPENTLESVKAPAEAKVRDKSTSEEIAQTDPAGVDSVAESEKIEGVGVENPQVAVSDRQLDEPASVLSASDQAATTPNLFNPSAQFASESRADEGSSPFSIEGEKIGEPISFVADQSLFSQDAEYTYILHRGNGSILKLSTKPSFVWYFGSVDNYRIELQVRENGKISSYFQHFLPVDVPLAVKSYTFNSSRIPNYEEFIAEGKTTGGAGQIKFRHILTRPNKQTLLLSANPKFSWIFQTPGQYDLTVFVEDAYGRSAEQTRSLTVTDSSPYFLEQFKRINVTAFDTYSYAPQVRAGKTPNRYEFRLSRGNGSVVSKWSDNEFKWKFINPDQYILDVRAIDEVGRTARQRLELKVLQPIMGIEFETAQPQTELKVYEPIDFKTKTSGAYGKVDYRYVLTRANGDQLSLANENQFSWIFLTPGKYTLTVYAVDELGRAASYERDIYLQNNPVRIQAFPVGEQVVSGRKIGINAYDEYRFSGLQVQGGMELSYRYTLTRENGQNLLLHKGDAKDFEWRFLTPGKYEITAMVVGRFGGSDQYTSDFVVLNNDPRCSIDIPKNAVTDRVTVFLTRVEGGGKVKLVQQNLIRANGQRVFMGADQELIPWTFATPGNYTYEVRVQDELGAYWTEKRDFTVYANQTWLPEIKIDINENKIYEQPIKGLNVNLNLSFDGKKFEHVKVFAIPKGRTATTQGSDLAKPELILSSGGTVSYHFPAKYAVAGLYDVYAVGLERDTGVEYGVEAVLELLPNLPRISGLYVNTSRHDQTGCIIVTASVDPSSGIGPLKYNYYSYSWRYGKKHLGEYGSVRQTIAIDDVNIGAVGLEVKDILGRNTSAGYVQTSLSGAWSFLSSQIRKNQSGNSFVLAWDDVPQASGYAIFKDGSFHVAVGSNSYSGNVGLVKSTYHVVPFYNLDGKSRPFTLSATSVQISAKNAFEQITVVPLIEEARRRVVEIAVGAEGRIPYGIDGKMDYSKTGYDAVTSRGLNCSGFVEWVFRTAGYTAAELGAWNWTASMMVTNPEISKSQLLPGDLGFARYAGHLVNHTGIFVGYDEQGREIWAHLPNPGTWVMVGPTYQFNYFRRPRMWV